MRERRAQLDDALVERVLVDGADKARAVASKTLSDVRAAMGMY